MGPGRPLAGNTLALRQDDFNRPACYIVYDDADSVDTVILPLLAAGLLAWGIVTLARREVNRREAIAACGGHHLRYLDESHEYSLPIYRCKRCPWQEPARDVQRKREAERVAALIERCPKCGGAVRSDGR